MIRNAIIAIFSMALLMAQTDFEQGVEWYNKRADGHDGNRAQLAPITKAIEYFEKAFDKAETRHDAGLFLLKSHYYRGKFAYSDDDKKKEEFNAGTDLGRELIKQYPNDVAIRYWYLVNLGSWAEVYGILAAAKEGVADQMKEHSEYIIENDPTYNDGAGYFMLGAVHFKTPYIPFLLSWPDNDDALANMKKAVNTGLATPTQKVYLAQIVRKKGDKGQSVQIIKEVIATPPRDEFIVEDLDEIQKAKALLEDWL